MVNHFIQNTLVIFCIVLCSCTKEFDNTTWENSVTEPVTLWDGTSSSRTCISSIELKSDKSVIMSEKYTFLPVIPNYMGSVTVSGKYKISRNNITLIFGQNGIKGKINDKTLTLDLNDTLVVYYRK